MTAPTGSYVGNVPLPNRLDPHAIEGPLYARAVERRTFHVPPETVGREGREPFVIVIPPPNVTSVLHMGHGLNNTIQDVLIRWRRMQGRAVVWVPGTDHAGIATQNVVERMLAGEGKTRFDVGREAFVDRVWEYVTETGGTILDQLKAVGASCDWERTRFTLDPGSRGPSARSSSVSTRRGSSTGASTSSTGARAVLPHSRTRRPRAQSRRDGSTTCAIPLQRRPCPPPRRQAQWVPTRSNGRPMAAGA